MFGKFVKIVFENNTIFYNIFFGFGKGEISPFPMSPSLSRGYFPNNFTLYFGKTWLIMISTVLIRSIFAYFNKFITAMLIPDIIRMTFKLHRYHSAHSALRCISHDIIKPCIRIPSRFVNLIVKALLFFFQLGIYFRVFFLIFCFWIIVDHRLHY